MKLKSNGCKPLITGRFKTRQALVNRVVKLAGALTQEKIGEECGVSPYVVCRIMQDAVACGELKLKYFGSGI